MTHNPADDHEEVGRVSPTAPASKSASANVWGLLERVPGFNQRVKEGRRQLKAGERVEFEPDDHTR